MHHRTIATAIAAVALLATACGGDTDDEATPVIVVDGQDVAADAPSDDDTASDTADDTTDDDATNDAGTAGTDAAALPADVTDEDRANAFAQCLRDEGMDVGEPTVNPDGTVGLAGIFGDGPPRIAADDQDTVEGCSPLLEGGNFGGAGGQFDQTEIQDQLVAFAGCLREQGLDVRDPDLSGGLLAAGADGPEGLFGLDLQDPQYEEQVEACADLLAFLPGAGGQ